MTRHPVGLLGVALAVALTLGACTDTAHDADAGGRDSHSEEAAPARITVSSTDDRCEVSVTEAPSGSIAFEVTNDGSEVTEFYLYGDDGRRVVGEVENIGPGLTRELVVQAAPGEYVTACKPGMTGDGIRGSFTVTDSGEGLPGA